VNETKAVQQKHVGQGLALGAIMLDLPEIHGNKTTLEFAFRHAWRDWNYRDHYDAVDAGPHRDSVFHIMSDSRKRGRDTLVFWESDWPFIPALLVDGWTANEIADIINDQIPAAAWADLVRNWMANV
jgi:hypothetical protein